MMAEKITAKNMKTEDKFISSMEIKYKLNNGNYISIVVEEGNTSLKEFVDRADEVMNSASKMRDFSKLTKIRVYRSAIAPGMVLTFRMGKLIISDIIEFASEMGMEILTIKPIKPGDYYLTLEVHLLCDNP